MTGEFVAYTYRIDVDDVCILREVIVSLDQVGADPFGAAERAAEALAAMYIEAASL